MRSKPRCLQQFRPQQGGGVCRRVLLLLMAGCGVIFAAATQRPVVCPWSAVYVHVDTESPVTLEGLSNVVMYHPDLVSGGSPGGALGFKALSDLGVRTVISVDGAIPDVEAAAQAGLRYVHLPVHYGGLSADRHLQLARSCRDALRVGGVYVHCHHGQHRSAAAAAVAVLSLGWARTEDMLARMRVSGTSRHYAGLFESVECAQPIPKHQLDAINADFPAVSRPAHMTELMVEMNHVLGHLELIAAAQWQVPVKHPDLVPAAEAARLFDLYRRMRDVATRRSGDEHWRSAEQGGVQAAAALERLLTSGRVEVATCGARLAEIQASCQSCHSRFRDERRGESR